VRPGVVQKFFRDSRPAKWNCVLLSTGHSINPKKKKSTIKNQTKPFLSLHNTGNTRQCWSKSTIAIRTVAQDTLLSFSHLFCSTIHRKYNTMVGTKTEEAGKPTKEEPKVVDEATNEATAAVKKDDTTTTAASTTTTTTTSTTVAPATGTATGAASAAATTTTATTPTLPPMPPIVLKDINGKIVKPDNERKEIPKRKGEVLKRPQDASTVVTRNGKTWDQMFDVLVEYKAKNDGSTQVPDRYKTDDGVCLGLWVRNQRRRKESLTEDQRSRLTELGIDWQTQNERFDNVWHERYAKLTEYRVEHGDCRVPYTYKPDPALAKWVSQQVRPFVMLFIYYHMFGCVCVCCLYFGEATKSYRHFLLVFFLVIRVQFT